MERKSSRYYIGHASNQKDRYRASSGGIGTAVVKYLLESGEYATAMTFRFNKDMCMYEPLLIHSFEDYNNCGSIYQDIDIISFVKSNLHDIQKGIIVTCMPCQVTALRSFLSKNNIPNFIISFSEVSLSSLDKLRLSYFESTTVNKQVASLFNL